MELNNLRLCFALWIGVEAISILAAICHKHSSNKAFRMKQLYFNRMLYLMERKVPWENLLQECYMNTTSCKPLQRLLFKAMSLQNPNSGFRFMTKALYCEPIRRLNGYLAHSKERKVTKDTIEYFRDQLELWITSRKKLQEHLNTNRLIYIIEKTIFMITNLALYFRSRLNITLFIFIVVNTIGVVLFIVLDYECVVVDEKFRDRKLARNDAVEKKTLKPALRMKEIFQTVASLGLIINVTMLVEQYLDKVI